MLTCGHFLPVVALNVLPVGLALAALATLRVTTLASPVKPLPANSVACSAKRQQVHHWLQHAIIDLPIDSGAPCRQL